MMFEFHKCKYFVRQINFYLLTRKVKLNLCHISTILKGERTLFHSSVKDYSICYNISVTVANFYS